MPVQPQQLWEGPLLARFHPVTAMAKGYGSHGGAVLERKKVTVRQKMKTQEPKLDQGGGAGGIGKILFNGGGGDDDGGDDDDYFKSGGGDGDDHIARPLQVSADRGADPVTGLHYEYYSSAGLQSDCAAQA